jgi:hypothetical protein
LTNYFAGAAHNKLLLRATRGTSGTPDYLDDNDVVGAIKFEGMDGTGTWGDAAEISVQATQDHASGKTGSEIIFKTTANDTDTMAQVLHIDNTLVLDDTVYNDVNVGSLVLQTGGTLPGIVELLDNDGDATGIYTRGFSVGEQGSGAIEIPHDYKEGTNIAFHIHWGANVAPDGGTDNVQWNLTYTVVHNGDTLADSTTIAKETAYTTQYASTRSDFTAITGTNFDIGDQFIFTIARIAASSDEFGGEALVHTLGLHYETDTLGSRTITAK